MLVTKDGGVEVRASLLLDHAASESDEGAVCVAHQ